MPLYDRNLPTDAVARTIEVADAQGEVDSKS